MRIVPIVRTTIETVYLRSYRLGREQTLLMRIAEGQSQGRTRFEPSTTEDLDELMNSVRHHLGRLLNARHGMCEALPDYGLPALTDLVVGSRNYIEAVQDAIRTTIEQYEPRLRRVRVSRVEDDEDEHKRSLAFRVDAMLKSQSGDHRVWYQTELTGAGDFEISD